MEVGVLGGGSTTGTSVSSWGLPISRHQDRSRHAGHELEGRPVKDKEEVSRKGGESLLTTPLVGHPERDGEGRLG